MAVYTTLDQKDIEGFLARFAVGELASFKGIAEGVENTNYLLKMIPPQGGKDKYILTLFEHRVDLADLPFFLGLTEWLADRGIACPRPVHGKDDGTVYTLKGKPAALIEFIEGTGNPHITPRHLELAGGLMARMHVAAQGFPLSRRNTLVLGGWRELFTSFRSRADSISPGLEQEMAQELDFLGAHWPENLPSGVIHADLFPDNVFFIDGYTDRPELSGVIDFYFACNDFWIYDLVICMNAWCFNTSHRFVPERARALLDSYNRVREITQAERDAMPVLARGAAMRFFATRAYDWLNRPTGALVNPKDPMEYVAKLRFHQGIRDWREYGF